MHFNVRATERLVAHGTLTGWFDAQSWYPYGRVVEDTVRVRLRTSTSLHPHSLSNPKASPHTVPLMLCDAAHCFPLSLSNPAAASLTW